MHHPRSFKPADLAFAGAWEISVVAEAERNRALAIWVGAVLGWGEDRTRLFGCEIMHVGLREGSEGVCRRLLAVLRGAGKTFSEEDIRSRLAAMGAKIRL